jgi:hypothetical protein
VTVNFKTIIHHTFKKGREYTMTRLLSISMVLSICALAVLLGFSSSARAQVVFPYSYSFEDGNQDPIVEDGNWGSATSNNNSPHPWIEVASGGQTGGAAYLAAWSASNKYARLLLTLNTPAFSGGEYMQFYIMRDGTAGSTANDFVDISIDLSVDGTNFTTLAGPSTLGSYVSTANVWQSQFYSLPAFAGGNLYIAITVKAQSGLKSLFDNLYIDDFFIGGGALPIQLVSSSANVIRDNDVEVSWKTASETNNYGFDIYRRRGESEWTKIGFVAGHGTTLAPQSYSYVDRSVSFGQYSYRIKQVDLDGASKEYPEMEVAVATGPDKFVLAQNYPNPFNPSTIIDFVVPRNGFTTMKVYNLLGQAVATLYEGNADAGKVYTTRFNASNIPSGLYFYTLRSAGKIETKRMILMK